MIITLGGDGTILHAVNNFQKREVPGIIGFNMGTLGFMCNNKIEELEEVIIGNTERMINNRNKYEERMRLQGEIEDE